MKLVWVRLQDYTGGADVGLCWVGLCDGGGEKLMRERG